MVWLALLLIIFIISLVYYLFLRHNKYNRKSVSRTFLDLTGSLVSQSLPQNPLQNPTRVRNKKIKEYFSFHFDFQIVFGTWILSSLLISLYYKSSLMASLVVPSIPPTIQNLNQLLKSNLEYGIQNIRVSFNFESFIHQLLFYAKYQIA